MSTQPPPADETIPCEITEDPREEAQGLQVLSDAELLDGWIQDQQPQAFAVLVQRYSRMVLSVCRRRCRTLSDADDAYQTAFLILAHHAHKIRRPECLPGWLQRVAQRAADATLHRSTPPLDPDPPAMNDVPAAEESPLDGIARRHEAIVLDEELAALPEHYRSAIVMHLYEGQSVQHLAEQFQTTLGAVRGRLQRGKQLLARRLRCRGVVPVLAFAAAGLSQCTASEAAAASSTFLADISSGTLPPAPTDPLLQPLVSKGARIMTPWNTLGSLAAVGTLAAVFLSPSPGDSAGNDQPSLHVDGAPILAQVPQPGPVIIQPVPRQPTAPRPAPPQPAPPQPAPPPKASPPAPAPSPYAGEAPPSSGDGKPMVWEKQYRPAKPTSQLAQDIQRRLDEPVNLSVSAAVGDLERQLEQSLSMPVIIDDRAISYAKLEPSRSVSGDFSDVPLRTALRKLLRPLGLKATVQDEALVVTADPGALVHQGIGVSRWINVDETFMEQLEETLAKQVDYDFQETPLSEAVATISQDLGLPLSIDRRSMEEIGLDQDVGVTAQYPSMPAYDFLSLMLSDLDCTLNVVHNQLLVSTLEAAEDNLLSRVYWLEGLNAAADYQDFIQLIESNIVPGTWEALGGNSSISPFDAARPAIAVRTTYGVHRQIERVIAAFRENSFVPDDVPERVQVPDTGQSQPFGMGGGMGGMGGGMGGGGGFF
ncbi:sigma-70 family RNA polymerase sigma factor [Roseiconus nitratireducens]|uniref:Sigma-70 family RNA polymerase sigma factor n=1 Tax=Roseiconus nitratireducens TaxID=2605748 RepID=A0A5M6CYW1_9BACT|nr:sigma-70 family RNA polymerase sigma factor [Roseiconus nitratireducens]KAA5539610.1 sigma-70 family RNA polymerase sigma factor [Roseiconus nitratireducens]